MEGPLEPNFAECDPHTCNFTVALGLTKNTNSHTLTSDLLDQKSQGGVQESMFLASPVFLKIDSIIILK